MAARSQSMTAPTTRDSTRTVVVGVLLIGFALSSVLVAGAAAVAQDGRRDRFEQRAMILRDGIRSQIGAASEVLFALRSLYEIDPDLSRGEFQTYASALGAEARTPGLRALEHAAAVDRSQLDGFVAAVRDDPSLPTVQRERFSIKQSAEDGPHLVIDAVHPFDGNEAAFGLDLRGSPNREAAVERAQVSGSVAATEPIELVQEPGSRAFLLGMPLYATTEVPTGTGERTPLAGMIVAVFHVGDLLAAPLETAEDIEVELFDIGDAADAAPGEELVDEAQMLFDEDDGARAGELGGQPTVTFDFEVGGRRWVLRAAATPDFGDGTPLLPVAVGAGGVAASLLGAALAGTLTRGRAARRQQIFESFLEFAPDAVVLVDARGRIAQVNRQAESLFGYARHELVGRPVEVLLPADLRNLHRQHVEGFARDPSARPMGAGRDLLGTRRDGATFAVDVSLSMLQTEAGPLFAAAVRDVTDRRRVQQDLEEAAEQLRTANTLKDQFLDVTAHELRTPLTAIEGFAEVLTVDAALLDAPAREELIERISVNAREMRGMVNRLMELSRLGADRVRLDVQDIALDEVVAEVLDAYRPTAEGHILTSSVPAGVQVLADPTALWQILSNLLSNAVKFSPAGTSVAITSVDLGEDVEVQVIDQGPGIPESEQPQLFEHFVQGSTLAPAGRRGAGIGLNIVRRYVDMLGGTVGVRSRAGHGATFWFRLPLGGREVR